MDSNYTTTVLASLGGAGVAYLGAKLLQLVWFHFLRRSSLARYKHGGKAKDSAAWALVTGASDGIGRGFAEELLAQGFNVVIHGRNRSKLEGVRKELLEGNPAREVRIAVLDAHPMHEAALDGLVAELADVHLTVLVNNVGGSPPGAPATRVTETIGFDDIAGYIGMNAAFPAQLTAKLLPVLRRNAPALVVDVGSIAGRFCPAYLAPYASTKAFNHTWSASLHSELVAEGADVEVLCLLVGEVRAQWNRQAPTLLIPSARTFARSALHKVGSGYRHVTPYFGHAVQVAPLALMPEWANKALVVHMSKQLRESEKNWKKD